MSVSQHINRCAWAGAWGGLLAVLLVSSGGLAYAGSSDSRELRVSMLRDGRWVEVGALEFDRFQGTRTLRLPSLRRGTDVRLRLQKRGGGMAHLDAVSLDNRAPLGVVGAPQYKLAAVDDDVADATAGPVRLLFSGDFGARPVLSVRARIEPTVIGKTPFLYPPENRGASMQVDGAFYRYRLGSRPGRLRVDGELSGESLQRPLFAESIYVDSGHPQGATHGWVRDDGHTLYVALDFTPDNTVDGELDYAEVFVRVNGRLRRFRVTQSHRRWGKAGFTYTRRVSYQHKVYEFAIPLAELGSNARTGQVVELAFATYGTAARGTWETRCLAFDPISSIYAFRFWRDWDASTSVQFYDDLGFPLGAELVVEPTIGGESKGGIAADSDAGRFLVTYDTGSVIGQLVDPAIGLVDGAIAVSDNLTGSAISSRVAYDPDQGRFLVVWIDDRTGSDALYGRFVNADGTTPAPSFFIDDSQKYTAGGITTPNLEYNSTIQEFVVVNVRSDVCEAWRLAGATGATVGTVVTIQAGCFHPDVAYEPTTNNYLVIWRGGDIYGRLMHADGTLEPVQALGDSTMTFRSLAVTGQGHSGRFFVNMTDTGNSLWGRFVSSTDGLPEGALLILRPSGGGVLADWPCVAANQLDGTFGVANFNQWDYTYWFTVLPTLEISAATALTSEWGTTDTMDVSLVNPPTGHVYFEVTTTDTTEATVTPALLHFDPTNYANPQTVTVYGVDDAVADGDIPYDVVLTVIDASSVVEFWHLTATIPAVNENDDYALVVSPGPLLTGEDGTAATFDVRLPAPPAVQVVVDITVSDNTEAVADRVSLTFDATNAAQPQVVTVTGVDDTECDFEVAYTVHVAVRDADSDAEFHGLSADLNGTNADDEPVGCDIVCGDGIAEGAEGCDDGNTEDGDGCSATCTLEPVCGDGIREGTEACDDGNTVDGDGCSATCTPESLCGNGVIDDNEGCDDGNTDDLDGCSSFCQVESGWTCLDEPSYCEEDKNTGCGSCQTSGGPAPPILPILLALGLLAWIHRRGL